MEIQFLRLHLSDRDLEPLAARLAKQADGIDELAIRLTPEGVVIHGQYPTPFGFKVSFDTLWEVKADGPVIHARLTSLKMAGVTASLLRGALMKMVRDAVEGIPGLSVADYVALGRIPWRQQASAAQHREAVRHALRG